MPSLLGSEVWNFCLERNEPWSVDTKLYQPFENEQILLPDRSQCLAIQSFLVMCDLPYKIEYRANAEFMSPSGKVPFLKCGSFIVSGLDSIISFAASKGKSLSNSLTVTEKADSKAFISLVNNELGNAELYMTWLEPSTYNLITRKRYGYFDPFPLNYFLCFKKKKSIYKLLSAFKWADQTIERVYERVDHCCCALSDILGSNKYFFGDTMMELDALVFGHVYSILTTTGTLAGVKLADTVRKYEPLVAHCKRIACLVGLLQDLSYPSPYISPKEETPKEKPKNEKVSIYDYNLFVFSDEEFEREDAKGDVI